MPQGWADIVSGTQLTNVGTTEQFFAEFIVYNPGELSHLQLKTVFAGGADADLLLNIYATLDGASEDWDTEAFTGGRLEFATSPGLISFPIRDVFKIRVGVMVDANMGSVAATSVDAKWRLDNVDLTAPVS